MNKIEQLLREVENPQVYTGLEINRSKSEFSTENLNICLVFPDIYEIGMSHQGLKILYRILDNMEGVNVERAFLPKKESIRLFREKNVNLFSLENRIELNKFDLVGFSLLSELSFTNVLLTLDLADIPLRSADRGPGFPIVGIGGISGAANPEPMRDFVDFFAVGDGETLFPAIVGVMKKRSLDRDGMLMQLDSLKGIYVPSNYSLEIKGLFHKVDMTGIKKKEVLNTLGTEIDKKGVLVPVTDIVFNRLETEIARGCPQNCRFCQARVYYSPFRVKSREDIYSEQSSQLKQTGFEAVSFSSLSSGDHPEINGLIEDREMKVGNCVSMSLPSLRPSTLDRNILSGISKFRKTGITIVPEAGSERLRKVINKEVSENEILEAVEKLINSGWNKIKMYFMIGLPFEENTDLVELVRLIEKILEASKKEKKFIKLHLSFSPFVPKPHTPFQWSKRENRDLLSDKIIFLKNSLKRYRNVKLDFHRVDKGEVETILSRGDASVGKLILDAYKAGEVFTAWDKDFNMEVWAKLIAKYKLEKFLEELPKVEILPWDFIELGYKKEYLLNEYEKAVRGERTPSCLDMKCENCNGCFYRFKKSFDVKTPEPKAFDNAEQTSHSFKRILIYYRKSGGFIYFSHLALMKYLERLLRRTGVLFKCTEGFHPRIKMSSPAPLPVLASGEEEVVEIYIEKNTKAEDLLAALKNDKSELEIVDVVDRKETSRKLSKSIKYVLYKYDGKIDADTGTGIRELAAAEDEITLIDKSAEFKIFYPGNGIERFGKMLRLADPKKEKMYLLMRKGFKIEN